MSLLNNLPNKINFGLKEEVSIDLKNDLDMGSKIQKINNGLLKDIQLTSPQNKYNIDNLSSIFTTNQENNTLKGIIQESPLSHIFFSNENINGLQNTIRYNIFSKTKQIIEIQSPQELLTIMRSIYLKNSNSYISEKNFVNHIQELNKYVYDFSTSQVLTQLTQYNGYIKKLENLPEPIDRPKYSVNKNYTYDISNLL
jgi:hypothetical protein